jgi:tricorn protease
MMIKPNCLIPIVLFHFLIASFSQAQISARMFRYPDVSATQIAFTYAGDIWIVSKEGGTANKLSSPEGEETFARFSPDGTQIAFTANYDGNDDIYILPASGGTVQRLTYHGGNDQILDWHPDGNRLLFASSRESGRQRFGQFFTISKEGGMPEKLPLPYGSLASFSPDGQKLAFNFNSRISRTWKRYQGGMAPDIWTYDLSNNTSVNITNNVSSDEFPMWVGNTIYYLSDQGTEKRYNLWSYDIDNKIAAQLTTFSDVDVHFPAAGPTDIVFEAGGKLYLMDLASKKYEEVTINVITDQITLTPKQMPAEDYVNWIDLSPDGNRLIVEARGDVFSVPAKEGVTKNLTHSSGTAERFPAWSPDGKYIAYWSDASGEYQLTVFDLEKNSFKALTNYSSGFKYQLFWSPDSKKLAFVNQEMDINYFDIDKNQNFAIDKGQYMFHGSLSGFTFSWSPDSQWLAYANETTGRSQSIFLYDTKTATRHEAISSYYNNFNPVFDPDGKYLYFFTQREMKPVYGDFDNTFTYPNSTQIAAVPLTIEEASPLAPKNDSVSVKKENKEEKDDKKEDKQEEKEENEDKVKATKIDMEGFEHRIVLLPMSAGNYAALAAVSGKVIYHQFPNAGAGDGNKPVKFFDLEERETKTIVEDADGMTITADGKKIGIMKNQKVYVLDIQENQKTEEAANLANMQMIVEPKAEWEQIFHETWRLERDYFYDKNMHGLDWEAVGKQYEPLIDQSVTRWDVNYVLGELIGELNASHTYRGGGDEEEEKRLNVGYLGIDWALNQGAYQIKNIIQGADWDIEVRSPLDEPGVDVNEGDYILAVNGLPLRTDREPSAAFQGLGGETVELTVNSSPKLEGARSVVVKTLEDESRLRHLAWIEQNREKVDKASNGRIGYIYVRSTGIDGQNELVRQFNAQYHKDGLIIDERFNSGGQIPDRFIELLNRKPLAYWAVRDGKDWQWPPVAQFGPKAMLINGWSGSGGDAFPDYFKKSDLGPLIGTRTWGGLIGISGAPQLIDGGNVTVPTFRMYDPDGKWFKEGHGVDPDIEVKENPGELAQGVDAQLNRAIEYIMKALQDYQGKPDHPAYEKR